MAHRESRLYPGEMPGGGNKAVGAGDLLARAEKQRKAGWLRDTRRDFEKAAITASLAGNHDHLVEAALGVGGIWVHEHRGAVDRAKVKSIWGRALELCPTGSVAEARLRMRLAAEAIYEGAPIEPVFEALEGVKATNNKLALAEALSLLHHVELGPRHADGRLTLAEQILHLGAQEADPLISIIGLCWRTVDLFLLGDPRAEQSLSELTERSAAESCEAICYICDVLRAMLLARAGRLEDAEHASEEALRRGNACGDPDAAAYYGALLASLRWWQGREREVVPLIRHISTSPLLGFNDHVYLAADALLSATCDDSEGVEEALARIDTLGLDRLPPSSSWLTTVFLLAETAFVMGHEVLADTVSSMMAPFAHLPVMPSLAVVCLGSAERSLGLCAAVQGRHDAAVHHLEIAIGVDRRLGNRPMAVLSEHTLRMILEARRTPGDEGRVDELTARTIERSSRIGLALRPQPWWLESSSTTRGVSTFARQVELRSYPEVFQILVEGRKSLLPTRVGFSYLCMLVSRVGENVDALELTSFGPAPPTRADQVIDAQALSNYRRRVRELKVLLGRIDVASSTASKYRSELSMIESVIRSSVGINGKTRLFPDNVERARTAVRKAIVRAVDAIEVVEPQLAVHLRASVVTGRICRYLPAPGWRVTADAGGTATTDVDTKGPRTNIGSESTGSPRRSQWV